MQKKNNIVFIILHIIAWIIFVGLAIESGALLTNFGFSIFKPEMVSHLYQKLDMSDMYNKSWWTFYSMYSFILFISILKTVMFYVVIQILLKLDLTKPFSMYVAKKIMLISYYALSIGIIGHIARQVSKYLMHHNYKVDNLSQFWPDSEAFILMAAVIYVIGSIFKKGVEIQTENDLTV
jgi:hypothetical protein